MRYERLNDLLSLVLWMQGSRTGVSLADIEGRFGVGRRTAQRMRDAVRRCFPALEEFIDSDNIKRWRLNRASSLGEQAISSDEYSVIKSAVELFERDGRTYHADVARTLANKFAAQISAVDLARIEPDVEAIAEAEGLAWRPGPKTVAPKGVVSKLRHAIKACTKVQFTYERREAQDTVNCTVCPYGFLFGRRHYLVGRLDNADELSERLFILGNVTKLELLDAPFERDPVFSLEKFAERSFGVFQEEPFEVEWCFSGVAADDAKKYRFHPKQEIIENEDGSVTVKFTAGGLREMAWHLYTWGDQVEVIQPRELAALVAGYQRNWNSS